ncbi:MAG: transglycosylase SLT domain-containing protein [Pararhizobium sp.]
MRRFLLPVLALCPLLAVGCTTSDLSQGVSPAVAAASQPPADVDRLIVEYASAYAVPADLVRSVVRRESNFNPQLAHNGHYGLMQISAPTARTMGYDGAPEGLLDARTNLKYGVKYLRGAYLVAGGNSGRAAGYYRSGYYYRAKRLGLLERTGLKGTTGAEAVAAN